MAKVETIKIRALRSFAHDGEHVEAGSVIEIEKREGEYLTSIRKAEKVDPATKLHTAPLPKRTATTGPAETAVGAGQLAAFEARLAALEKENAALKKAAGQGS